MYEWTKKDSETLVEDYNNQIFYIDAAEINMDTNGMDYTMSWESLYTKFLEITPLGQ
jgi:hypothetical protein